MDRVIFMGGADSHWHGPKIFDGSEKQIQQRRRNQQSACVYFQVSK